MRHFIRLIAAAAVLAVLTAPVSACLWGRDTLQEERKFKSLYQDSPGTPTDSVSPVTSYVSAGAGAGAGVLLLAAAGYLGLVRRPW